MGQSYGPKLVTDSLVLCFDGSDSKATYANFNDNDIVTEFYNLQANGGSGEETLELGTDPWGRRAVLDRSLNNDTGSNYDGGDTSNIYAVANTSKYRFTYFFRVDKKGSNGTLYFGLYGYNSSTQNIGVFSPSGTGSANTNPYFSYPGHNHANFTEGQWYMFVAYVHPEGSTDVSDGTAGYYHMGTGEKVTGLSTGNINYNGVWQNATTQTQFRYYLYYSTDPTVEMSWYEPRIDLVDGNEPSITDMLNNPPNRLTNLTSSGYNARGRNGLTYDSTYQALNFSRTDKSHLIVPHHDDINITGDMTVECWVYLNSAMNGNLAMLVVKRETSDYLLPYALWFEDRSGQNKYAAYLGGVSPNYAYVGSNDNFNGVYNKWDYVCFTVSGTTVSLYVNGVLDTSGTFSGTRQSNSIPLRIGGVYSWYTEGAYHLDGKIGSTRIHSRALSAAEVKSNFNAHRKRFGV